HRCLADAGDHASRAASGDARHSHGHHHRHGARPGRDGSPSHDRHGRVHRGSAEKLFSAGHGAASTGIFMGGQSGTRVRGADLGGDPRIAHVPAAHESGSGDLAAALSPALVKKMDGRAMPTELIGNRTTGTVTVENPLMSARAVNVYYGDKHA